jgi:hypothetical protein
MLESHLCERNVGSANINTLFLQFYKYADCGINLVKLHHQNHSAVAQITQLECRRLSIGHVGRYTGPAMARNSLTKRIYDMIIFRHKA